jgi:hypothetical protein
MAIHTCGLEPEPLHHGVEDADLLLTLGAVVVDELPDHRGADEGDRHGQEDEALGQRSPPDAVGQDGDDEAEEGAGRRHHQQPEEVVEDGGAEARVIQGPAVVVEADKGIARLVVEGEPDGLEDGIDQIDGEQDQGRAQGRARG